MTGVVVCSLFRALTKWERLESERHAKKVAGRRKKEKKKGDPPILEPGTGYAV